MLRTAIRAGLLTALSALLLAGSLAAQPLPDGPDFVVNQSLQGSQSWPEVARLPSGDSVVAWQVFDYYTGTSWDIAARILASDGTPKSPDLAVNTYRAGSQYGPSIAALPSGDFVVVWASEGQDGEGYGVFGRRFDSLGGRLGGEFQINQYTPLDSLSPHVAADPSGSFVVSWSLTDPNSWMWSLLRARRFDSLGNPLTTAFDVSQSHWTAPAYLSNVGTKSDGSFAVVWQARDPNLSDQVLGRIFDSRGYALGPEFTVNTYASLEQRNARIAMDPNDGFLILWDSNGQDGDGWGIFGRRYDSTGAALGGELAATAMTTGDQRIGDLVGDGVGGFLLAFYDYSPSSTQRDVWAQPLDPAGAPQGAAFKVNSTLEKTQEYPRVALASPDDFLVVWETCCEVGTSSEIIARDFSPCVPSAGWIPDMVADLDPGAGEITLSWTDDDGGDLYHVYEDPDPAGSFATLTGSTGAGTPWLTVTPPAPTTYYLVAAESLSCGPGPLH